MQRTKWWGFWCLFGFRPNSTTMLTQSLSNLPGKSFMMAIRHIKSCYDVIMSVMASQITSISIVYWTVCSGADQRKHQSSASLAYVRGIHQSLVDSPHKGPVMWKMFPFDDIIMLWSTELWQSGTRQSHCWCWVCITTAIIPNVVVNTLRLRQNGHHFAENIFKWIFLNENVWILMKISLKFVPRGVQLIIFLH